MLITPQPPAPMVEDWLARHRDPRSFVLHLFGIPGTILGVLLIPVYLTLLSVPVFLFALSCFVGGYALQFLGHILDGTEPGEIRGLRAWWRGREARSSRTTAAAAAPLADAWPTSSPA